MMPVYVEGVGLCGPGLPGWRASLPVLTGAAPYESAPVVISPSGLLPATERRRTVPTVKLALAVGSEALDEAGRDPRATATVFSSSGGDGETVHAILEVLASPQREVSPTRFHNSVHNAPSGYWAIATQCREPTTSICCYDFSFAAGLVDAAAQVAVDERPVMLIAYDLPYPEPLSEIRAIRSVFGVALVLTPAPTERSFARLDLGVETASAPTTPMQDAALEELRAGNPAARSLPLLEALAKGVRRGIVLDYLSDQCIAADITPVKNALAA
jgi:hypothetical protein